jgi:hypothetical protein
VGAIVGDGLPLFACESSHATPTYQALGYNFAIRCHDGQLTRYLHTLFEPFRVPGQARHWYSLGDFEDGSWQSHLLYWDDALLDTRRNPSKVLATLLWHINREVVRQSQDRLLIHASGVSHRGTAVVFPAPMESGKTTLAAGLVRTGLSYITDETVAIVPASAAVEPFPRAMSVDRGSWTVLADLRPDVPQGIAPYVGDQWQVPPLGIRPDSVAGFCSVGFVISPRYRGGEATKLSRMSRAEAVRELAEHAFNFQSFGSAGLQLLAALVRGADCYRLQVGDLDEACELILDLVGAHGHEQVSQRAPDKTGRFS